MSATKYYYDILIIESHLDTFGHVNNATYLEILEEARWDLITKNGYGIAEVQRTGLGPVILEINIKFKKELRNREAIKIETYCSEYKGRIAKVIQTIFNQKGDECAVAEFVFGLFDTRARKLVDPTPEWKKALGL